MSLERTSDPLTRRRGDEDRLSGIRKAMEAGECLPPVELYKLGFGYYVLDGHHRVAAARLMDAVEIDAEVTEFVPLADPEAARTFAERRAFERSTGLNDVGAAHPESYRRPPAMIEEYQREHDIPDYRDAAQRWYGQVYRPLWHRIRERRLTRYFPGDRSADFVARLGAWRAEQEAAPRRGRTRPLLGRGARRFVATLASEQARRRRRRRAGEQPSATTGAAASSP